MKRNATARNPAPHRSCTLRSKRQKASLWVMSAKFAATVRKRWHHCLFVPHIRAAARMDVLICKPSIWAAARALEASGYDAMALVVAAFSLCGTCRRRAGRRVSCSDSNMLPTKTQGNLSSTSIWKSLQACNDSINPTRGTLADGRNRVAGLGGGVVVIVTISGHE